MNFGEFALTNRWIRTALVLLGCLCLSGGFAVADTVTITLTGSLSDYHSFGGETTGPYPALLNGGSFHNIPIFVFCFDIHNVDYIGQAYSGILGVPTTEQEIEAAYLEHLAFAGGGFAGPVNTLTGPISFAIWDLMLPSSKSGNKTPPALESLAIGFEAEAIAAYQSGQWTKADAAAYPIFTPDDTTSQRYGFFSPVPEPSSILLFGSAAMLAAGFLRRRRAF
jgi:hypothetical protein